MDMERPRLKLVERVTFSDGGTTFERNGKRYELCGVNNELWSTVFSRMDGTRTAAELCSRTSLPESVLLQFVDNLYASGAVSIDAREPACMDGDAFWRIHNEYCRGWLDRIAGHSLWPSLTTGNADRAVAVGFVIEKYHYIEAAHEHMAFAAANGDARIERDLVRHFQEEYSHGDIYLEGLASLVPKKDIVASLPLPSTRALVNFLNELAQSNSVAYYSANEFLQKTENVREGDTDTAELFYDAIERAYDLPSAICRSMRWHTQIDQNLGHGDVFREMCGKLGTVSREEVNTYLGATRRVVDHLEYFLDGIETFYSSRPYFPRPRTSIANI